MASAHFATTKLLTTLLAATLAVTLAVPAGAEEGSAAGAAASAAAAEVHESWYRIEMNDSPIGWMVEREIDDGERLVSEGGLRMVFQRAGDSQTLTTQSRFVESRQHEAIEMWSSQDFGLEAVEVTHRFEDDALVTVTRAGEQRRPLPAGDWLTPFAAQETLVEKMQAALAENAAKGDKENGAEGDPPSFQLTALDPSVGPRPVTTTWTLEDAETEVDIDGEMREASLWRQSQSFAPEVVSRIYLSPEGQMLQSTAPAMNMEMRLTLTSEEKIHDLGDGPELLIQSFIYPSRQIEDPRRLRRAVYRLTAGDGDVPELPSVGYQQTLEDGRVIVDLGAEHSSGKAGAELEDAARYLQSSSYLRHDDPAVEALRTSALADLDEGADDDARAEAARRAVGAHLDDKNLDSVLATAVDAAKSRSGDCTEHAVLLAAVLRSADIPARVATGVIYVERFAGKSDLFAYHMWTQAFYDGRWHDLDATLGADTPFDAAHITLDTPDLDDEGSALLHMARIAPLIGRASIEVVETETLRAEQVD